MISLPVVCPRCEHKFKLPADIASRIESADEKSFCDAHEADILMEKLGKRHRKICALVTLGMTNREIAEHLVTTEQVVKNYLRAIYDRTGMGNRIELAVFILSKAELHRRLLACIEPK